MYNNFVYSCVTEALPNLLREIHTYGIDTGSRVGRNIEARFVGITLTDPVNREILVPHRRANIAAQIAETMWVLAGRDDIDWLENYLPRVRDFTDDGEKWRAGYGARLRRWEDHAHAKTIDQWEWLVDHLRKQPGSRRAVMSIWDPAIDTEDGKDIPCNDWLSFLCREGYLDLHVAIRSNDIIWGWSGINQFEWSSLLEITAGLLGMKVGSLHFSTTSFHLYEHHFDKSHKIQIAGSGNNGAHLAGSPRFDDEGHLSAIAPEDRFEEFEALLERWFRIEYDIRTGSPLVQHYIEEFPEPMLRSWLRVLQWWWSGGDPDYLDRLEGTRLAEATTYAMQPKKPEFREVSSPDDLGRSSERPSRFIEEATRLHTEKHNAYGDSWKKRGEKFSIMPNIGRKIDRLGGKETADETSVDTAMDTLVYLAKYRTWLDDQASEGSTTRSDTPHVANSILRTIDAGWAGDVPWDQAESEEYLRQAYENLLHLVDNDAPFAVRKEVANDMMEEAYNLARRMYDQQQARLKARDEALQGIGDDYRGADRD